MAFVFRSELKSCFDVKADPDLGPGYYHKEEPQAKRKSPHKIPFLSSSPRTKSKKMQEVPGPGAYYNDEQFAKITKNIFNNNLIPGSNMNNANEDKNPNVNVDVIYRALENENIINDADPIHLYIDEQFEKLGFLSKNKRFKEIKNLEVPGPGTYLRLKSKSAKNLNKKSEKEKLKRIQLASLNKQKIETIPAKNHAFGYDYDSEGNLIPNDDPLKDRKHLGVKGSSVGPGNYELVKESDWNKKGVLAWGKTQSQTQNNFFKRETKKKVKKNLNNSNKSFSPEGKSAKFFNSSGSNFYNPISNQGGYSFINTLENNDMKNNNKSIKDAKTAREKVSQRDYNFKNKTFYAQSKSTKMRQFSHRKYSAGLKRNFILDTEENFTNANNTENQIGLYDKENFKAYKKSKRLSQSFEIEQKSAPSVKTDTDTMLKFFKEKNKKRKEILLMNHTNKLFDRGYLLQNRKVDNNPGPGYYLEENLYTSFKPQPLPEERQTFGSISQRFPYLRTADTLGPGAYFREDFKMEKTKQKTHKEKTMIPQFNKLKSYKPIKVEHNVLPGPGEYEPDKPKKRVMTAAAAANFGSKEPRFKKSSANEAAKIPGPGAYNGLDYWASKIDCAKNSDGFNSLAKILVKPNSAHPYRKMNKDNNFAIDADQTSTNFFNLNNLNNNKDEKKNNNKKPRMEFYMPEGPGVGAYNADAVYSLEYKIAKNCAKNTLVEAPFNSTKTRPRFDDTRKMTPSVIGPGIYHKSETKMFKQIYPAFKNTEQRFREAKSQYRTNPGQYDTSSYFDWNKKSFNILYL